jgi:hypothetical protein
MKKVAITGAKYLGGLPGDKGGYGGRLFIDDEGISVGQFTSPGKGGPVKWTEMSGISFDSEMASKSRIGKALMFGVFALAAKNSKPVAHVTVELKNGQATLYEVTGQSGPQVRGRIQPFLSQHAVPCLDDAARATAIQPAPPAPGVNDLSKLAELHSSGALTDEEFSAAKANLLNLS